MMNKNQAGWQALLEILLQAKDAPSLNQLLDLLLTAEERSDLTTRFLITKALLLKTQTQREIAKELNVSIAKITRGSNELKRMDPGFLATLKAHFTASK
jgi:TrpR family trp operon transcriptional repressor